MIPTIIKLTKHGGIYNIIYGLIIDFRVQLQQGPFMIRLCICQMVWVSTHVNKSKWSIQSYIIYRENSILFYTVQVTKNSNSYTWAQGRRMSHTSTLVQIHQISTGIQTHGGSCIHTQYPEGLPIEKVFAPISSPFRLMHLFCAHNGKAINALIQNTLVPLL